MYKRQLEYRRTGSTRRYHPGYECKWATNTVVHILENREYTGCLVNFKTEKPSYKTKHSVENPIEKQAIFPNHHEPIIDTETWERVQELRKQRKRPNRYDEVGLFSGMLFCADCGHVMYQQRYQNKNRKQDCYICGKMCIRDRGNVKIHNRQDGNNQKLWRVTMEYSKEDLMEAKKQIWGVGENMGTEESKKIWEENAQFWDNAMGDESNEFHREVVLSLIHI